MSNNLPYLQGRDSYKENPALSSQFGFQFKKRRDTINWRLLSSINVDRIARESDIKCLQEVLENITFCDIEREEFRKLDPNFTKLFQLSQLAIEYLLFTQDHLLSSSQKKEDVTNVTELTEKCVKLESQLQQANKENRQLKKTVYAFQLWSKIPGGIGQAASAPTNTAYARCRYCGKVFSGDYYLDGHLERRHADRPNYVRENENNHPQVFNIPNQGMDSDILEKITSTIERFSAKVLDTERSLRMDLEKKMADALDKKEHNIGDMYKQDRLGFERELQELKTMMTKQLEDERRLLREERMALDDMYRTQMRRSNIGTLEDDDDGAKKENEMIKKLESKYDNAFERLMSTLEKELRELKQPVVKEISRDDDRISRLENEKNGLSKELNDTNSKVRRLEDILAQLNSRPVTQEAPKHERARSQPELDKWPKYVEIMNSFKNTPFPKIPLVKSKFPHHGVLLSGKRKEVEVQLDTNAQKRGIAYENLGSSDRIAKGIRKEREDLEARDPYHSRMREYIVQELDNIAKQRFKLKPLKPSQLSVDTNTGFLPHRKDFFPSNSSMNEDGRNTSMSRRSIKSDASSIKWDDSGSEDSASTSDAVSETSEAPSPKKFDPKSTFSKAFNVLRATKPIKEEKKSQQTRKESLDPILKTAIGRVQETRARKDPLEKRKESIDDYEISDISESLESIREDPKEAEFAAAPKQQKNSAGGRLKIESLDDLEISD